MASIKELLAASQGAPAFFNANSMIGDSITGTIVATAIRQATDFKTGKPLVWDDGNPREQIIITLATKERDPQDPEDDGTRSIYVKWWGGQRQALTQAVKLSGDDDIQVGGTFTATFAREEAATERGLSATKVYEFEYRMPSATAGLLGAATNGHAPAPAAAPAAPATAPAPEPTVVGDPAAIIAQAKALIAAGVADQMIMAATGIGPDVLAAVHSIPS